MRSEYVCGVGASMRSECVCEYAERINVNSDFFAFSKYIFVVIYSILAQ
jgi:hypothetical protein